MWGLGPGILNTGFRAWEITQSLMRSKESSPAMTPPPPPSPPEFPMIYRLRVPRQSQLSEPAFRKVDIRLPGKGDSNSHGARPVYYNIPMIKRIRTSRLSVKNSPSQNQHGFVPGRQPLQGRIGRMIAGVPRP